MGLKIGEIFSISGVFLGKIQGRGRIGVILWSYLVILEKTWPVCQTTLFKNYFGRSIRNMTLFIAFMDSS